VYFSRSVAEFFALVAEVGGRASTAIDEALSSNGGKD
jgi:hypothetical protein